MPFTYSDPEVFLEHNGVTVWHVYKDDDMDQGARDCWYTTEIDGGDSFFHGQNGTFDYRELTTEYPDTDNDARAAIIAAIESGELPLEEA